VPLQPAQPDDLCGKYFNTSMNDLSRMKLLINLAKVDGQVADKEKNHLINIGRAHGIYPDEIYPLFTQSHDVLVPEHLSDDQKFDLIFSLIQLMKLDERMYREEIAFCANVAMKLGYDRQVMFELLSHVRSSKMDSDEVDSLKEVIQQFLGRRA
jgi:uncharacterized tellurite resistance protein B-like protein